MQKWKVQVMPRFIGRTWNSRSRIGLQVEKSGWIYSRVRVDRKTAIRESLASKVTEMVFASVDQDLYEEWLIIDKILR